MVSAATVKRLVSATLLAGLLYTGQAATGTAQDGDAVQQEQTVTERQRKLHANIYNAVVGNWLVLDVPASQPVVIVRFNLKRDGSLVGEPVVETQSDDPLFPQFAATAVRAVKKAAPFDLAAYDDLYKDWETVIVNFDGRPLLADVPQEPQPLPTLEELAGFMTEKGPATGKETETIIQVREKVERRNRESHVLALEKYMADGTPVTLLAYCGVDPAEGEFVYGVDFGLNVTWTGQQPVDVEIDGNTQSYRMQAMWRSLFIEGDTAKAALGKLLAASDTLKFSGPQGATASFDLKNAGDNFVRFKTLCAL